jgi:hypothetical protein
VLHERHRSRIGQYLEGKTAIFYHSWAMVILGLGSGMDVYLTGLWLPRAGAIVAGVAAWLYFFDPRTTDDWWALRQSTRREHLVITPVEGEVTPPAAKQKARIAAMFDEVARARQITYREAKLAMRRQHEAALRVQAFWLFMGTLIWAFGDIPVELLKCGRVPC